jgi:hypothetical protein
MKPPRSEAPPGSEALLWSEAPREYATQSAGAGQNLRVRLLRWCINVWVVLHFSAILAAAGNIGPTPGYVMAVWDLFHPYLEALFLNHGYAFFAPEPSPSTLMDFTATRPDGSIVEGRLPDPGIRPGLLYQRTLLLTEHIGVLPDELREDWYRSYAHHLCRKFGASKVHLTLLTHFPLPMEMVRNGSRLDAPFSYDTIDLGDFSCDDP